MAYNNAMAAETFKTGDISFKKQSQKQDVSSWLKENYPPIKGIRLEVRHLWDNKYRLKYWGENKVGDQVIKTSIFIIVKETEDGFDIECKSKDEIKWNFLQGTEEVYKLKS